MNNNLGDISDTQAEACVVASIIAHPEFILQLDFLQPNQFYNVENGCIYWSVQTLVKNGVTTIDAINMSNIVNSNNAVKRKIEEYNLSDFQDFINTSQYAARDSFEEVKLLAKNITTMAFKRDLNKMAIQLQRNCFNSDISLNELNNMANEGLNTITEKYIITDELQAYGDKVCGLWDEIVGRRNENGLAGIPFKFPTLNQYVTLEKTEVVAVAARLKKGKSALLMNQAVYAIMNNIPTVYIDTEMQDRLFHERLLANLTGVTVKDIKMGTYSKEEEDKLIKANEWLKTKPFYHIYLPDHTNEELYAIHRVLKNKMGLELSIFDYIKSNVTSASENYNVLGAKADFLKNNICGSLDIAMLTAVQLNREGSIADSDKIARHLSTILIWEEKTAEELQKDGLECGNFKLRVSVNRLGEQMSEDEYIDLKFDGNRMKIEEATPHKKEELPFD